MRRMPSVVCALPAVLLALALLLPFRDKAYTIDDTVFLRQGEHALVDPLHPAAFVMVWSEVPWRLSSAMPSGPVMAWLLAPAIRWGGGAERWAHAPASILLLLAILAAVATARRFGAGALEATLAGLVLAASPAVLGMAGTCMPDVPAMALGAIGFERFVAWREGDRRRVDRAVLAALAFALAALCRIHLVLLVGAAGLLAIEPEDLFAPRRWLRLKWHRLIAREAWPLLLALVLLFAGLRAGRDPQPDGGDVGSSIARLVEYRTLDRNFLAYLLNWSFALPLALPWALLRARELRWRRLWQTAPVVLILLGWVYRGDWLWLAPFACLGLVVLEDVFVDAWRRRDRAQLALGAWLLLSLPVVAYFNFAPKYTVASAPAVALLIARRYAMERGRLRSLVVGVSLVAGAAFGVLILRADEAFAGLGRRAVAELVVPRLQRGEHVWFAAHWGFQWYAERAGARCLTKTPPHPEVGDTLVHSMRSDGTVIRYFKNRVFSGLLTDERPGGRVVARENGAGFFSTEEGFLPWNWGHGPLDRFEVWTVTPPKAEKKSEEPSSCTSIPLQCPDGAQ